MAAKNWQEFIDNYDGYLTSPEMQLIEEVWEAAVKALEEKLTAHNRQRDEIKPDCGNCLLAGQCTYFGFPSDSCSYSARV